MIDSISTRAATPADAGFLVDIVRMAGSGLPERVWAGMAAPGEDPLDVGRRRAAGAEGTFSHRNATVFEIDGRPVSALVGYPLPEQPKAIGPDTPPAFVPLQELENLAPGTWYVNILGTVPERRGQGIGRTMLAHAESLSRTAGCRGMSIIVFSGNPRAWALYRRAGYREVARRTLSMPGWEHDGAQAVLLVK